MPNTDDPQAVKPIEEKIEAPIEEKQEEFSYKDIHEQPIKEIVENKEVPENKEEPKEEEKPVVDPKKELEEEVKIDPDKMAEEIANKVTEKLTPKEVEDKKAEIKDEVDEFFDKIKAEKGRDPDWRDALKFMKESAVKAVEENRIVQEKAANEQKEIENKATQELTKRFNETLDEELEELYSKGELTPIKDKSNPSDQGVVERKSLFQKMMEVNMERKEQGKPAIMSLMRIKYGYWTKPSAQPAGEDAPISMGHGSPAGDGEEQEISYKDIHNKPFSSFNIFGKK